jgi:hypothetical protein
VGVVKLFHVIVNKSTRIPRIINNTDVNSGINTIHPYTPLCIKGTNPSLTITGQGNKGVMAQSNLSTSDTTTSLPNCSLLATDTGSFGATFQIKQKKRAGTDAKEQFKSLYIDSAESVGNRKIGQCLSLNYNLMGKVMISPETKRRRYLC